jgi:hypothetical protein
MTQFLKNELVAFNDRDFLENTFWTQKFILQSACRKSLWAKNGTFVIIPAQLQQIYSDLPHIYWHACVHLW